MKKVGNRWTEKLVKYDIFRAILSKFYFIVYFEHLDFDPVTEMSTGTVRINPDTQDCFR